MSNLKLLLSPSDRFDYYFMKWINMVVKSKIGSSDHIMRHECVHSQDSSPWNMAGQYNKGCLVRCWDTSFYTCLGYYLYFFGEGEVFSTVLR